MEKPRFAGLALLLLAAWFIVAVLERVQGGRCGPGGHRGGLDCSYSVGMYGSILPAIPGEAAQNPPSRPAVTIEGAEDERERRLLDELVSTSYAIMQSEALEGHLRRMDRSYPHVFVDRYVGEIDPETLASMVSGADRRSRYASVRPSLVGGKHDPSQNELAAAGQADYGGEAAIYLGRAILEQFASTDAVERSCAVNAVAHEISHTLSVNPIYFKPKIGDTSPGEESIPGRDNRTTPLASYLLGSLAQCIYLEEVGRIEAWRVPDCVTVFGVRGFNGLRCDQFSNGEPVELRAELPPPSEGL